MLMNRENAIVIDIRSKEAYQQKHIINATSVVADELSVDALQRYQDKQVVLVDKDGMSAFNLARKLKSQGAAHIAVLQMGFEGWLSSGFPTEKN
jgi:rhodanese-related sulfurtransferase